MLEMTWTQTACNEHWFTEWILSD